MFEPNFMMLVLSQELLKPYVICNCDGVDEKVFGTRYVTSPFLATGFWYSNRLCMKLSDLFLLTVLQRFGHNYLSTEESGLTTMNGLSVSTPKSSKYCWASNLSDIPYEQGFYLFVFLLQFYMYLGTPFFKLRNTFIENQKRDDNHSPGLWQQDFICTMIMYLLWESWF